MNAKERVGPPAVFTYPHTITFGAVVTTQNMYFPISSFELVNSQSSQTSLGLQVWTGQCTTSMLYSIVGLILCNAAEVKPIFLPLLQISSFILNCRKSLKASNRQEPLSPSDIMQTV